MKSTKGLRRLDIAIGIPTGGMWDMEFGKCLASMVYKTTMWKPSVEKGIESLRLRLYCQPGSMLVKNRQILAAKAIQEGCSHLLFLDDDMSFPDDLLIRLIERDKPVIAVNCTTRSFPVHYIAHDLKGKLIDSRGKVGCQKVQHVGCAVMMLETELIKRLTPPLFMMDWIPDVRDFCGEDVYFCAKLGAEAGAEIWIDHDLSQEVGHIGRLKYGPGMIDVEAPQAFEEAEESKVAQG